MNKITIGLIGEDPLDTSSIRNLLLKRYKAVYIPVLKRIKGTQLDNTKFQRMLKAELSTKNLDILIFIRDLDGWETETVKIKKRNNWFKELSRYTKAHCLFLLNIYELEALIISDITTFNGLFGSASKFKGDPMKMKKTKEFLISMTRKLPKQYTVSQNPKIFEALRLSVLQNNCRYFNHFLKNMDEHIKM